MSRQKPLLTRKINIAGRVESVPGTAVTLTADDAKTRVYAGAEPEYAAPREERDVARASLTPIGSLESTKALNFAFRAEANTRDTIENLSSMDVESIVFQSAIAGGAGSIQRITFNGTPDLSAIVAGQYYDNNYSTNSTNDGTFLITNVNDGSDFIDVVNRVRINASDDEASLSPAIGDIQNTLEYQWALNACMSEVRGITRLAIGSISGGPFVRNETITGGTSAGTARVVVPAEDGDSHIYVEPLTGKLVTAEVLTGGTSSATVTSSSGPVVHGHFMRPVSGENCNAEVATIEQQNDGFRWKSRSSVGNLTFEAAANMAMFFDFAFQGPKNVIGDATLFTVTRDNEDPPIMKTAELKLDTFSPVFSSVNFDMGLDITLRENGNALDDSGFEAARATKRRSKINIIVEHELAATFDFFAKLDAGTKTALQFHVGTVVDKKIWFFADELEFEALPVGDKEGIRTLDLAADCTGSASDSNDDWEFALI